MTNASQNYRLVPVTYKKKDDDTRILHVQKLDATIKAEHSHRDSELGYLELRLLLTYACAPDVAVTSIDEVSSQKSLESAASASDRYFRPGNVWLSDIDTIQLPKSEFSILETKLRFLIGERPASEHEKEWSHMLPSEGVQHLSFYAGMKDGFNWWRMYRLDYSKLQDVKFDFIKQFAYVSGQAVNEQPQQFNT